MTGSSPLTRGKPNDHRDERRECGLIPAHAGKTTFGARIAATAAAHPRSRGENFERYASKGSERGSSPLTRGKQSLGHRRSPDPGLIPAHAGKTRAQSQRSNDHEAHPRSRGENIPCDHAQVRHEGSSPLTRGKRIAEIAQRSLCRLIPAHAGKTCRYSPAVRISGGSSPLTRGKRTAGAALRRSIRLIPAHAGKTVNELPACGASAAHPRSRGENALPVKINEVSSGSSPLTRGKHFLTCAFTAQIDQILETLELAASFGSYLIWVACATDAPQDPVRSIGLVLPSSMGAS